MNDEKLKSALATLKAALDGNEKYTRLIEACKVLGVGIFTEARLPDGAKNIGENYYASLVIKDNDGNELFRRDGFRRAIK